MCSGLTNSVLPKMISPNLPTGMLGIFWIPCAPPIRGFKKSERARMRMISPKPRVTIAR